MGHFGIKKDRGHTCWSFLLAKDEKRCGEVCCPLHNMSKSIEISAWFVFTSTFS
jgi:hypothetical protein